MLTQIEGYLDEDNRPCVSLRAVGFSDPLEAVIDTGFYGSLKISFDQAKNANLDILDAQFYARVASGQRVKFLLAEGELFWLGEKISKTFLVNLREPNNEGPAQTKSGQAQERGDQPVLLGAELLENTILRIDYCARTVTIAPC